MAFDDELRVVEWNDAAVELTGIPVEDAVGRFCWEVLCGADDRGSVVCHAGCSNARLAREGWAVPTRRLSIKTRDGRRSVAVATVAVNGAERPLFLHLLRNGEEIEPVSARPSAEKFALTARQREILGLLADGVPAKVIASRLNRSETTVRNHIRAILSELGCHSQLEAVAKARRVGLLEP
jgi:DNA-binding CsgD family transcriptional regulator